MSLAFATPKSSYDAPFAAVAKERCAEAFRDIWGGGSGGAAGVWRWRGGCMLAAQSAARKAVPAAARRASPAAARRPAQAGTRSVATAADHGAVADSVSSSERNSSWASVQYDDSDWCSCTDRQHAEIMQ